VFSECLMKLQAVNSQDNNTRQKPLTKKIHKWGNMKMIYKSTSNQDETKLLKAIEKLRIELQQNIELKGSEAIRTFLSGNFALPKKGTKLLIQIFEDMITGVPHDAIPEEWYFKRKRRSKKLTDHIPDLQREYPELRYFVERFQKLSDNLQLKLRDYWPDELWSIVKQRHVTAGNRHIFTYSPSYVAKEILAYRYDTKFETVNSYLKRR